MTATAGGGILVVEDDIDSREALVDLLEGLGHRVHAAADGEAAFALLRTIPAPCLILLDLMMPTMNGFQFRVEQQRTPELAEIPVIVISAQARLREEAVPLGAVACITKPIDVDRLLELIDTHC